MKYVRIEGWNGRTWPSMSGGKCEGCGIDVEEGDGVYVSSQGEYKAYQGVWCPKCYILPGNDIITRCI